MWKWIAQRWEESKGADSRAAFIRKWKTFFNIVFDPWVILLTLLVYYLAYHVPNADWSGQVSKQIATIFTVMISIVSGLLGGICSI